MALGVAKLDRGRSTERTPDVGEAEVRAEVARHFCHERKLASYRNPVSPILHAKNDHLITLSHAERNLTWSGSPTKKLVVLPHGDHNTIMPFNHVEYFQELRTLAQSISADQAD